MIATYVHARDEIDEYGVVDDYVSASDEDDESGFYKVGVSTGEYAVEK